MMAAARVGKEPQRSVGHAMAVAIEGLEVRRAPAAISPRLLQEPIPLPVKFEDLLRKFAALDSALALARNISLRTFSAIKRQVQKTTKRAFTAKDLGQIIAINPNLYDLSVITVGEQEQVVIALPKHSQLLDSQTGKLRRLSAEQPACAARSTRGAEHVWCTGRPLTRHVATWCDVFFAPPRLAGELVETADGRARHSMNREPRARLLREGLKKKVQVHIQPGSRTLANAIQITTCTYTFACAVLDIGICCQRNFQPPKCSKSPDCVGYQACAPWIRSRDRAR